jgi:hypothetical protein
MTTGFKRLVPCKKDQFKGYYDLLVHEWTKKADDNDRIVMLQRLVKKSLSCSITTLPKISTNLSDDIKSFKISKATSGSNVKKSKELPLQTKLNKHTIANMNSESTLCHD